MTLTIPTPTRPYMKNYGIKHETEGMMTWDWVQAQMEKSQNYWICTVRPDGRPHAAPVWGVLMDNLVYFGTDAASRKGRNIQANPNLIVHLESGIECVIIEGLAEKVSDAAVFERIAPIYSAKYKPHGYEPTAEELASSEMYRVHPQVVMAWLETSFPETATRWQFA